MTDDTKDMSANVSGGLKDLFYRMMGLANAGALSPEAMGSFERLINQKVLAAERLALITPMGTKGFEDAREVLGYKDAHANEGALMFPKPAPRVPESPNRFGGVHG